MRPEGGSGLAPASPVVGRLITAQPSHMPREKREPWGDSDRERELLFPAQKRNWRDAPVVAPGGVCLCAGHVHGHTSFEYVIGR